MSKKLKILVSIVILGNILLFSFMFFGLYLLNEEDKYGDLVYFQQKVKDGDLIFRCNANTNSSELSKFNEFGVINKSWNRVYVSDLKNDSKENLYEWALNGNGSHVRVFRISNSNFKIENIKLENNSYNNILKSDKLKFIVENY